MTDTTSNSLRSRLPRIFAKAGAYNSELQAVIRAVKANHPKADVSVIEKSFVAAEKAHATQLRKSGEPYITHPLAVAQILADLGIGATTILRTVSAWVLSPNLSLSSFVTPSTNIATSSPKSRLTKSRV